MDTVSIGLPGFGNQQYLVQMRQLVMSALNDAVKKSNGDNGDPLKGEVNFSTLSSLLSKLAQLQKTDPQKFTSLMYEIADKLKKSAEDTAGTNSQESKYLTELSDRFKVAAESGDLSVLQPKGGSASGIGANIGATLTDIISKANEASGKPLGDLTGLSVFEVMQKMADLMSSNPTKFEALANSIADALQQEATSFGGANVEMQEIDISFNMSTTTVDTPNADMTETDISFSESITTLSETGSGGGNDDLASKIFAGLANRFRNAAETGDMSRLIPTQQPDATNIIAQAQFAQYLSVSMNGNMNPALDFLQQLLGQDQTNSAHGAGAIDLFTELHNLLSTPLQQLQQQQA